MPRVFQWWNDEGKSLYPVLETEQTAVLGWRQESQVVPDGNETVSSYFRWPHSPLHLTGKHWRKKLKLHKLKLRMLLRRWEGTDGFEKRSFLLNFEGS